MAKKRISGIFFIPLENSEEERLRRMDEFRAQLDSGESHLSEFVSEEAFLRGIKRFQTALASALMNSGEGTWLRSMKHEETGEGYDRAKEE